MQVLLPCGGHQKVIDVVGGGTKHEASNEQHALGACIESPQGHVISLSLHGWYLSRNLHVGTQKERSDYSCAFTRLI
jgi:hypothetical protein